MSNLDGVTLETVGLFGSDEIKVLTTVSTEIKIFWDVTPCDFIRQISYRHFRGFFCVHSQGRRNVVASLPNYTASHPRIYDSFCIVG
jgi:hypothetical protein